MNTSTRRSLLAFVVVSGAASAIAAAPARAPRTPDKPSPPPASAPAADALGGLAFRSIGPAIMGGRIDDFAVVEGRPHLRGHGAESRKTVSNGVTLRARLDDQEFVESAAWRWRPRSPIV